MLSRIKVKLTPAIINILEEAINPRSIGIMNDKRNERARKITNSIKEPYKERMS